MSRHCFLNIIVLVLLILPLNFVSGQVPVEKSTEKIVVGGNAYYMHTVKLGQTTYSISKAYGTTVEAIVKENPSAANGIKEGEVLRIPVSVTNTSALTQTGAKTQTHGSEQSGIKSRDFQYHEMIAGETVYSLSKKFNVTVADIVKSNPGININDIPIGTLVAIPSSLKNNETEKNTESLVAQQTQDQLKNQAVTQEQLSSDGKYFYHRVVKGETLQSLSRTYNVTVREIKRANRGFLFPKEGEYIQIPVPGAEATKGKEDQTLSSQGAKDTIVDEKHPAFVEQQPFNPEFEKTSLRNLKGSVKVAVLLPFFLNENGNRTFIDSTQSENNGQSVYKEISQSGDWIFEPTVPFVEMYEGILLAADSLRNLGLDITLDVYDTGADTIPVENLIASGKLRNEDLILGPVFSSNLIEVAKYARAYNIPVVSPVPLRNSDILEGNTSLFRMSPSPEVEQKILAKQIAAIHNSNVVFVYSDSMMYDSKTVSYRDILKKSFQNKPGTDSNEMKELYFSGRMWKSQGYIDSRALESSLVSGKENVIVLATSDSPKVSGVLSLLHNLSRRFDIMIVGSMAIRDIETIDLKYFYDLRMMLPIDSYVDFSKPDVNSFLRDYNSRFKSEPNGENFVWRGFDMAYYFMGGIGLYGKDFLNHYESFNPDLLSFILNFRQSDSNHGFENQSVYIMQYNKDMTISVSEATAY
jgi:LysM repeat protein/ABC-type branched-subunit amino acid transport system substrate-binding protein